MKSMKHLVIVWKGWNYLTRPFEVIVSDMTSFWVNINTIF